MRQFIAFVFIYLLFVIQTAIIPFGPDLVTLALILFALYETPLIATLLGVFAGLCIDLVTPTTLGAYTFALGITAYTVARVRNLFYRTRWHNILFTLFGLALKTGIAAIFRSGTPPPLSLLISSVITLALSPFVEPVLAPVFYRHKIK